MSVYRKLLLSHGGGISAIRYQAKDTVSIIIGLGGTGIDCIRAIKTQVYSYIKPDNSQNELFSHIKFLGVDCALKATGLNSNNYNAMTLPMRHVLPLEESEFFLFLYITLTKYCRIHVR